ncbi:exodeoxyribonuclease VII large subunit [Candidatus Trichorickettsia mobilis]|uniref:exodeoxyribonuclease VII large subunit n=1 Tax=Candidatus Trichorickettsia mobilis TaxID=1346319 RepID=UPI00292DC7AE|nr:exodeoxyribonuclease VII large subunit [Candidatus Trichorickettsia mobilis]
MIVLANSLTNSQSLKEFSVNEISNIIKELLELNLGVVRIRGEISGLKIASSGHAYFNLKDHLAVLGCTCWRPTLARLKVPLADGMEVIATGKVTAYAGQSRYQLSIEKIDAAGDGLWMQILTQRQEKLAKEGLFAAENKKPLPFMPKKIAVVTSITGVVIRDIIHRIVNRFPTSIIIWPVTVQGENSAAEIASAISGFNNLDDEHKPDLIIVARGGGSIEDLWSFNEEIVVRSTAASKIPIISAVGHETDYTLIDFAADKRAPTPTAAAEFAVPVAADLHYTLKVHYNRLLNSVIQLLKYQQQVIGSYVKVLRYPTYYIETGAQKIDELGLRLVESMPNLLQFKSSIITQLTIDRLNPGHYIDYCSLRLNNLHDNLTRSFNKIFDNYNYKLHLNSQLLSSLDYNNTLRRGFAIIKTDGGKIVSSRQEAILDDKFSVKFHDGELLVQKLH